MTPPHIHVSFESDVNTGKFFIRTLGLPGIHVDVMAGTQGAGVKTPAAADVAAAVAGLLNVVHRPKDDIFRKGTQSFMVAIGALAKTPLKGNTVKVEGMVPKLHFNTAPEATKKLISKPDYLFKKNK